MILKAMIIPFPGAIDNHQMYNARKVTDSGGGWLLEEGQLEVGYLTQLLTQLLESPVHLSVAASKVRLLAKPNATCHLAEATVRLASLSTQENWVR